MGTIYTHKEQRRIWKVQKENPFISGADEYEEWFKINDKLLASELAAIRELLPAFRQGIEIGVGTGIFAARLGIKDGVEPSEAMAQEAREKDIKVFKGVAEDLPVKDGSYQLALMVTVECFLDDVRKAFSEVWRILDASGIFIIAFIDKATPLGQIYDENKHLDRNYQHAHFQTADEIESLLNASGFEVIDTRQTVFSLENIHQEIKPGVGEGVFAVMKARKLGLS